MFVRPTVVPIEAAEWIEDASGPAGASRGHDTRQLHAMASGLVGQTINGPKTTRGCDSCLPMPRLRRRIVDNRQRRGSIIVKGAQTRSCSWAVLMEEATE
jgi:hypothetical protein